MPFRPFLLFASLLSVALAVQSAESDRPNIVWIVSEDNSVDYLRLYDAGGAPMPHIERLAEGGIIFNHAFSQGAVCSVARSTIISGCFAPRVLTQFHRRERLVPLPEGLRMFPWYLRRAGYHATNNAKEDYNFIKGEGVWDESSGRASYRDRMPGQPFFHVQNFGTTHEGRLHFPVEDVTDAPTATDPATVAIFPHHPDTALFRYTNARYRDLHRQVDAEIGEFLAQMEADGVLDDTIIFYYGDHGGVLPGSKGYSNERGLHVPMVVRAPARWQHLLPVAPGTRVDGFVQFADLAPTVLNLAGIEVPAQIDGRAFLGPGVTAAGLAERDTTFGYADRFDEKFDMVRTWRRGNFKYVRNYQPFNVDGLQNNYRYFQSAFAEWRDLHRAGKLNAVQSQFFDVRAAEALYDLDNDPFELVNLADDFRYREIVQRLREELTEQVKDLPDLSFFPEPVLLIEAAENPVKFGRQRQQRIARLVEVADLSLGRFTKVREQIAHALRSADPWERYWGLIVCSSFGEQAKGFAEEARRMASADEENLVRMRAAEFLGLHGWADPVAVMEDCLRRAETLAEAALILNSVTLLADSRHHYEFALAADMVPAEWTASVRSNVSRRFQYLGVQ